MTRNTDPVVKALEQALADTFTLALKTQNYHWNVEGQNFYGLHKLLEEHYEDAYEAADEIAERIRALGATAPGSLRAFQEITKLTEAKEGIDSRAMIDDLVETHATVTATLKTGVEVAEKADDVSTADMLTSRITVHDKAAWMLRSIRA